MVDVAKQLDASRSSQKECTRVLRDQGILIIVENLPVPFDRRVWQEARTLRDAGANVSIICPIGKGHEQRYERLEGIDIYRHPLRPDGKGAFGFLIEYSAALFWESVLAWRIFLRRRFGIIHACNPPDLIFLVALPFKVLGVRFLFDHHDINPELYEAKFGRRGLIWRLMVWLEYFTFKTADVVISTNESYRQIALERGAKEAKKVFVVRSGPDLSRLKTVPYDLTFKNGRDFLVGYVGVMGEQEGINLLLESVRHLVYDKGRKDVQFVLVGGGPQLEALRILSRQLQLEDYVTFVGRAPDEVLFKVLSTADVCVNPDRVNEMNDKSTMNKVLEYMAYAKPIVQFDVTEGRVSAGDSSLYAVANDPFNFADKIAELLDDPGRRKAMGRLGRQRVEQQLAWEYEAPKLLLAYDEVLR